MLPAKWRPKKDAKIDLTALLWPIENPQFLLVLPPERWSAMLEKLKAISLTNSDASAVVRFIGENSGVLELDRVGRFILPQDLADAAGLKDEALFVGGVDRFEIWSPEKFAAQAPSDRITAARVAKDLNL